MTTPRLAIAAPAARSAPTRAFTLVEAIVVVILLGVLLGLVVPRMGGSDRRRAEQESAEVQRLFTAAAQRDLLSGEPLALAYEGSSARLTLLAYRADADASPPRGVWREVPAHPAVRLEHLEVREATADGRRLPADSWRIELPRARARPAVSILLATRPGSTPASWQVDLLPGASAAAREPLPAGAALRPRSPAVIDLDATGRGERPW